MMLQAFQTFASNHCPTGQFLTFPSWYQGLEQDSNCHVIFSGLNDVWIVLSNVIQIVMQLAGLLALIFLIYGGIRYIVSQGEPDNLQAAKRIITYALIGLVVSILASTIVGFIAGQF